MNKSLLARKRAQIIMKVNSGLMTATQAAKELNISRKTYYQWEKKALAAMLESVTDQQPGRPQTKISAEQESLKKQLDQTIKENDLLRRKLVLKDIVADIKPGSGKDRAKKK